MADPLTSDPFLHALLLDGKGGASALSKHDVEQWSEKQGELWLHIDFTNTHSCNWLVSESGLPSAIADALTSSKSRPRVQNINDEQLLLILRGINLNPNADPDDMVSIRMLRERTRIISTRQHRLQSVSEIIEQLFAGQGPLTLSELMVNLADSLTQRIGDQVEMMDEQLELLEVQIESKNSNSVRELLAKERSTNAYLMRYLKPQNDVLSRLTHVKIPFFDTVQKAELFEINEQLTRHVEALNMLRERAIAAHDNVMNKLSEQLNQRLYLLAIISGVFLPLGFLTGLLGVNLGGIPGADYEYSFLIFLASITLFTVGLTLFLKRKGWF